MDKEHEQYLQERIGYITQACLKVEQDWLAQIGAPVNQLPPNVAQAVGIRMVLSMMPPGVASQFLESLMAMKLLEPLLGEEKPGNN